MNDYFAMTRHRLDREEALRRARNAQFADEALYKEEARLHWPRFQFISMIRRLLPKPRVQRASLPCSEAPLNAH